MARTAAVKGALCRSTDVALEDLSKTTISIVTTVYPAKKGQKVKDREDKYVLCDMRCLSWTCCIHVHPAGVLVELAIVFLYCLESIYIIAHDVLSLDKELPARTNNRQQKQQLSPTPSYVSTLQLLANSFQSSKRRLPIQQEIQVHAEVPHPRGEGADQDSLDSCATSGRAAI